jgi:hypothetical protein
MVEVSMPAQARKHFDVFNLSYPSKGRLMLMVPEGNLFKIALLCPKALHSGSLRLVPIYQGIRLK